MRINACAIAMCYLLASGLLGCVNRQKEAIHKLNQDLAERNARRSRSQELHESARKAHQTGDLTAARELIAAAVAEDDGNAHAWMQMGIYLYEQGELYDAAQAFRKASRLKPGRYEPHNNIGMIHESVGHWRRAIREYELAMTLAPDQVEVMENLAGCYLAANMRTDRAKHLINRALESESRPEWVEWLTGQAIRLQHLGRPGSMAPQLADDGSGASAGAPIAHNQPQQDKANDGGEE